MGDSAYSIAASVLRYVFILIMAFVIISVFLRSIANYRTLIRKKRRIAELRKAGRYIELKEPLSCVGRRYRIFDENFVGRAADDDICIENAGLKKHHAILYDKDGRLCLTSKCKKKVFINDLQETAKTIVLRDGDEVALCDLCFIYHEEGAVNGKD